MKGHNVPYAQFDDIGCIVSWGDLSPHTFLCQINPNYVYAPFPVIPERQFVDEGVIKDRPIMPVRREGMRFYDLPQSCEVLINDQSYLVENGELELSLPQPGIYAVRFRAWPYQDVEIQLEIAA